jgi:uncharacterized phage protein (TIGR02218 family)
MADETKQSLELRERQSHFDDEVVMRSIPVALKSKLDSGVTTLARCHVLRRRDDVVMGFTDHDRDLVVDGVVCRAGSGLSASEATTRLGLQVDGAELFGALADDSLTDDDLAAGRWDAARVDIWLVDWSEPALNLLLASGTVGEVRREGFAFVAEMRSIADRLAQDSGRLYTATCSADLGDARCGVDLDAPAHKGSGSVIALAGTSSLAVAGLDGFDDGIFTAGRLVFTSGSNAGLAVEVKAHRVDGGAVTLLLWQAMPQPIATGDAFAVTAGCDKRFATCRDRFANTVNFRGFPHIPGNDFVMRYPNQGEAGNDGGRLQG